MINTEKKEELTAFHKMGLEKNLLKALHKLEFKIPTSIQKETIPLILSGANVVGHAQTGTGKTAAFGIPALQALYTNNHDAILIITPTRELASQVKEELMQLGSFYKPTIATICGGNSYKDQIDAIKKGAKIVIATPGRLVDLLQRKKISKFAPTMVIVDEADEMLNMGFLEDIQTIFSMLPHVKQTLLFSATISSPIRALIKKLFKDPCFIQAEQQQITGDNIEQLYCLINGHERDDALIRLLELNNCTKALIFCRTKKEVDRVAEYLHHHGFAADGLHGDMKQSQRDKVIKSFRLGKIRALVATDVAARGINILDISHVMNYHMPFDAENYVHRIGRTGRAGKKGKAISLTTPPELKKLLRFSKFAGGQVQKKPIPTKKEIQKQNITQLIHTIQQQTFQEDISLIAQELNTTMDWQEISRKLLSLLYHQKPIHGPEKIGIEGNIQKKMQQKNLQDNKRRRFSNQRTILRKKRFRKR